MYRKMTFLVPATIPIVAPVVFLMTTHPAFAYIGPGAGLSAIGAAIALVGVVGLAIVGFVWYPARRLTRRMLGKSENGPAQSPGKTVNARTSERPPG